MTNTLTISQSPLGLVEILRDYGVEELGGLFIYLPLPRNPADQEAWAWLETARLAGAVRSGPWRIEAQRAPFWLRATHPKLFAEGALLFEAYRLDSDRLAELIDKIGSASGAIRSWEV